MDPTPTMELNATPLDAETVVRLEAAKIASAQHMRMNATPAASIIAYAAAIEHYIRNGVTPSKDEDPLS